MKNKNSISDKIWYYSKRLWYKSYEIFDNLYWSEEFISTKNTKKIKILSKEQIGSGLFSRVYKAKTRYKGKELNFVLKEYRAESNFSEEEMRRLNEKDIILTEPLRVENSWNKHLDTIVQTHHMLKKADIPTRNTVRKSEYGDRLLMTLGSDSDNMIFSYNNSKDANHLEKTKISEISNMDMLLKECKYIVNKAAQTWIYIHDDAYFFSFNTKTQECRLLIGDLDCVEDRSGKENKKAQELTLLYANRDSLKHFLEKTLSRFFEQNIIDTIMQRLFPNH